MERAPMIHNLKTWSGPFEDVKCGLKTFELRKNDRDYRVGDFLLLQEYDLENGYSQDEVMVQITHLLSEGQLCPEGYVCMSIELCKDFNQSRCREVTIEFHQIKTNISSYIQRAEVPGGWLVCSIDDVWTESQTNGLHGNGYEWRTGVCFVPDPDHRWLRGAK
jgi:hypothetical protein